VSGFGQLTTIGGDLVFDSNEVLVHIDGFGQLTSIGGNFWIRSNYDLTDVNGKKTLSQQLFFMRLP